MAAPTQRTAPVNSAFAGGNYAPSALPTSVGGALAPPGAGGGPPPAFGTPATTFARDDRGSNIRIPYARVVPLRNSGQQEVDGVSRYEYDGLDAGELAWVLSKQFGGKISDPGNAAAFGHGVDRMQRLADTDWLAAAIRKELKDVEIDLQTLQVNDADSFNRNVDSEIDFYSRRVNGDLGSVLNVVDVARQLQATFLDDGLASAGQPVEPQTQGLFCMEQGPFLRSYGATARPVEFTIKDDKPGRQPVTVCTDRHTGGELAQRALAAAMKREGLLNWTPDGITLSKLETGPDGETDAHNDARVGRLYNVGVQGPCITRTWTGNSDLATMPMDRLFVVLVATLRYATGGAAPNKETAEKLLDAREGVGKKAFADAAKAMRNQGNEGGALLYDFRLKRVTSAYLAEHSHFDAKSPKSRCGLKIGFEGGKGAAEYIVGGWCIGTVLDAAASRALGHASAIRTAPASMAVNVNVCIEWWSAHKLWQHYQDVEGTVKSRVQWPFATEDSSQASRQWAAPAKDGVNVD